MQAPANYDPFELLNDENKFTVFVKTITNYFIGKVVSVIYNAEDEPDWVCLFPAAWVADQGIRQSEFLANGVSSDTERERYETPVWFRWQISSEAVIWRHEVPESNNVTPEEMEEILRRRPEHEARYATDTARREIIGQGSRVFIKTATNFFIGDIIGIQQNQSGDFSRVALAGGCAWVADQGIRQSRFLSDGVFDRATEIERYNDPVLLNAHLITEVTPWAREIPDSTERPMGAVYTEQPDDGEAAEDDVPDDRAPGEDQDRDDDLPF